MIEYICTNTLRSSTYQRLQYFDLRAKSVKVLNFRARDRLYCPFLPRDFVAAQVDDTVGATSQFLPKCIIKYTYALFDGIDIVNIMLIM